MSVACEERCVAFKLRWGCSCDGLGLSVSLVRGIGRRLDAACQATARSCVTATIERGDRSVRQLAASCTRRRATTSSSSRRCSNTASPTGFTGIVSPGLQHVDIAAPSTQAAPASATPSSAAAYKLHRRDNWVLSAQGDHVRFPARSTPPIRRPSATPASRPTCARCSGTTLRDRRQAGLRRCSNSAQRFRAGAPPNELRADATFGVRPAPQLAGAGAVVQRGLRRRRRADRSELRLFTSSSSAWSTTLTQRMVAAGRRLHDLSPAAMRCRRTAWCLAAWYRF